MCSLSEHYIDMYSQTSQAAIYQEHITLYLYDDDANVTICPDAQLGCVCCGLSNPTPPQLSKVIEPNIKLGNLDSQNLIVISTQ